MRIERKKLVLIIAVIVTAVLAGLIIFVSAVSSKSGASHGNSPVSSSTSSSSSDSGSTISSYPSAPIEDTPKKDPNNPSAPPTTLYQNNYSHDTGYTPLPKNFNPKTDNTANTVYDQQWALNKINVLACELSNKETVTPRALQPLTDFYNDLALPSYANAVSMRNTIQIWLNAYRGNMGQHAPGSTQADLAQYCGASNSD